MSTDNYFASYDANLILEIDGSGKIISITLASEVNSFDRCKHLTQGKYRSVEDHNKVFDMLSKNYGYLSVNVEAISGDVKVSMREPVEWSKDNLDTATRRINELMEDKAINDEPLSIENVLSSVLNEQLVRPAIDLSNVTGMTTDSRLDYSSQGLTHSQIDIACENIGINLDCGGCARLFYAGYNDESLHDENCTGLLVTLIDKDGSNRVRKVRSITDTSLRFLPQYVSLSKDGSGWFIKCECFDSFAGGTTISESIDHYWSGLIETIFMNLDLYGYWNPKSTFDDGSLHNDINEDDYKFNGYHPKPILTCPICKKLSYISPVDAFGFKVKCSTCGEISSRDQWITQRKSEKSLG